MPGGYKDPRVAPYLKGVKHVEPIQRKHNAEALPPGWAVAAHSQTLYRTGAKPPRVYYINEEGGNTSWSRPRDTRKDFEKYKLKEKHVKLLGDDRPSLVCKYDDKALVKIGKKKDLVRKRELSIAKVIRKLGPVIYITRILFNQKSMFFDTWKIYTHRELKRKAEERQVMALKIQGRIRIKQAKNRVYRIKHAARLEAKVKIKDIHQEIGKYLATCTPEDIKWYNDWTRGQQHSGYPGVILMTAEEKRRKKALKALESRKLIKTKKKGPGRRRPKKT